ncbi:hypothetical protein BV898_14197 [Hypsibius exemplaris]|uniref:Uncharacterized protein n=1 Tax=Hypsibius exemplaris TaxID=2072580 RepID=A0A1W0W8K9_HYPEX|nr:hypothetical protein BV898_14197 [Hypsibius exemplaris]
MASGMTGMTGMNPMTAMNPMNPFGESPGSLTSPDFGAGAGSLNGYGSSPVASYAPAGYNPLNPMNAYRSSSGSIGSICYCDVRINKLGSPGDLLYKLHYPTINAQTCQVAIQQCATACKTQAQRQLTGNVLFEEGGLENLAPDKDVSVGTVLCKDHGKIISPPGVIASVFAKPDACGRAQPIYDLTGEETRLCCTLIAHPYIRTEHVLVFSPECIAGVAPPAPAAGAAGAPAAGAAAPAAAAATVAPPAQAPEPVPGYNQIMPQFRHYDPMNAMMNAFG